MTGADLDSLLRQQGLFVRGVTRLEQREIDDYGLDSSKPALALVGNIGSSYWPQFSNSSEYLDGDPEPLDRWSKRIAADIAASLSMDTLFPFEGPPYYPFQQWAKRAEDLVQSPIGVMMHPEFGLWHSYRFALLGTGFEAPTVADTESPCLSCTDRPCLHTCPVEAFDDNGYDVDRCAAYLRDNPAAECNQRGCLARYACPVAPDLRYLDAQGQFHLRAFVNAH